MSRVASIDVYIELYDWVVPGIWDRDPKFNTVSPQFRLHLRNRIAKAIKQVRRLEDELQSIRSTQVCD